MTLPLPNGAGVEDARLDGVSERLVVHHDRVERVGQGDDGVHLFVGLTLRPRFAEPSMPMWQ